MEKAVGRFAPSPTGRMHLGNVFTALLSWLSVRKAGGRWILRIEDLDPQRSRREYAEQIEDDLRWLGLEWDQGGLAQGCCQSQRSDIYAEALARLRGLGLTYPCRCTRADLHATQAPHASDGILIYPGTCRPKRFEEVLASQALKRLGELEKFEKFEEFEKFEKFDKLGAATRIYVPEVEVAFEDAVYGGQSVNLARECGDFVLQRADGAFAYQLAVTVDDALMGVTEVVRGSDLLLSSPRQIYLYRLLGYAPPRFAHVPLLCNGAGVRLSKRDASLSMEALRKRHRPEEIIGRLAYIAGLTDCEQPLTAAEAVPLFDWAKIPKVKEIRL